MLPAVVGGMPWSSAAAIYLNQANLYRKLAMSAPTIFAWFPDQYYDIFVWFGLAWAAAAAFGIITTCIVSPHQFDDLEWLRLSLAQVLVVPFLTPGMHDRYFYPADILSLVYAFYLPRRFFMPIVVTLVSVLSYLPYLVDAEVIPIKVLTLVLLVPIGAVVHDLVQAHAAGDAPDTGGDAKSRVHLSGLRRISRPISAFPHGRPR